MDKHNLDILNEPFYRPTIIANSISRTRYEYRIIWTKDTFNNNDSGLHYLFNDLWNKDNFHRLFENSDLIDMPYDLDLSNQEYGNYFGKNYDLDYNTTKYLNQWIFNNRVKTKKNLIEINEAYSRMFLGCILIILKQNNKFDLYLSLRWQDGTYTHKFNFTRWLEHYPYGRYAYKIT